MNVRIDPAALDRLNACPEGREWLARALGNGAALDATEGLRLLQEEGREDFMAWVFCRVPAWREGAPEEARVRLVGPRHRELADHVDRLACASWLRPEEPPTPGTLQPFVDQHLRRLSSAGYLPPALAVPVARLSLPLAFTAVAPWIPTEGEPRTNEAGLRWHLAYAAAAGLPPADAARSATDRFLAAGAQDDAPTLPWLAAMQRLAGTRDSVLADRPGIVRQFEEFAKDCAGNAVYRTASGDLAPAVATSAWQAAEEAADLADPAGSEVVRSVAWGARTLAASAVRDAFGHALWLLADNPRPSPYEPLLALWDRGVAPLGVIDDVFVVADPTLPAAPFQGA